MHVPARSLLACVALLAAGCSIDLVLGTVEPGQGGGGAGSTTSSASSGGGEGGAGGAGGGSACGALDAACCEASSCDPGLRCELERCVGCIDLVVAGPTAAGACARTVGGDTWCWGDDTHEQVSCEAVADGVAPTLREGLGQREVAAVSQHLCAVEGTALECWGRNDAGQLGATAGGDDCAGVGRALPSSANVALAGRTTVAVLADGTALGWGSNAAGQLSIGGTSDPSPHPDPALLDWGPETPVAAAVGASATCLLALDRTVRCAGTNDRMQLGTAASLAPGSVSDVAIANVVELRAGRENFCARLQNGDVWCWGAGDDGVLGQADGGDDDEPTRVLIGPARALALGSRHACAILAEDDEVVCWGNNARAALGVCGGATIPGPVPILDAADEPFRARALAAGIDFTCAVDLDDRLHCWGENAERQCGLPDEAAIVCGPRLVPIACD